MRIHHRAGSHTQQYIKLESPFVRVSFIPRPARAYQQGKHSIAPMGSILTRVQLRPISPIWLLVLDSKDPRNATQRTGQGISQLDILEPPSLVLLRPIRMRAPGAIRLVLANCLSPAAQSQEVQRLSRRLPPRLGPIPLASRPVGDHPGGPLWSALAPTSVRASIPSCHVFASDIEETFMLRAYFTVQHSIQLD